MVRARRVHPPDTSGAPGAPRPRRGRALRRALAAAVGVSLVAAVLGLGGVAAPVDAELAASVPEVQACEARPQLGPGSVGPDVRCLQYLLILLGLPVRFTGVYDEATQNAVRWYQASNPPLRADGVAGEQTLIALGIRSTAPAGASDPAATGATVPLPAAGVTCLADAEQSVGEHGQSVVCIQRTLIELGLYTGRATGTFDAALQQAVRAFQQAHPPLQVDGRAGSRTLAAMGIWSGVSPNAGVATGPPVDATPVVDSLADEPKFLLTPDGIPFYANRQACTRDGAITIATEFARDGADLLTQYWAVYVASREGGCRFDAINVNPATRDDSHCTFQLNVLAGMFEPHGELGRRGWTPEIVRSSLRDCADAASDLWVFCGRGPWTPPYSCAPPWEGAASTPKDPIVTTTTAAEPPAAPEPTPTEPVPTEAVPSPGTEPAATAPVPAAPEPAPAATSPAAPTPPTGVPTP